jgi:hypothetical protein
MIPFEVHGTFRGIAYAVRLVRPPPPSDMMYAWYGAEWEIDCERVEGLVFPAFPGDTESSVRSEAELILAMALESSEGSSRESA